MSIAIIGAGNVGQALTTRLALAGEDVRFGVRDPARPGSIEGDLRGVPVEGIAEACRAARVIILAVPAAAAMDAVRTAAAAPTTILVDATNPLRWDQGPVWTPPPAGSVAQAIANEFPALRVLKGFNHFGAEIQRDPAMAGGPADAWFAGDDAVAKDEVMRLAARMGFRPGDAGPLRNAGLLENLAVLWIHLSGVGGKGRQFALRADHRP